MCQAMEGGNEIIDGEKFEEWFMSQATVRAKARGRGDSATSTVCYLS